jgi:hypothetical protein
LFFWFLPYFYVGLHFTVSKKKNGVIYQFENELKIQKDSIEKQQSIIIQQQNDIDIQQKQSARTQETLTEQEKK